MLACVVLGDSLAVGVGQARPDCRVAAVSGISSDRYIEFLSGVGNVRTAIISLGVNDGPGTATEENLLRLRVRVSAVTVYWLLTGTNPRAREAVRAVARRFGDRLIDAAPLAGPDHVHPDRNGYAALAALTGGGSGGPAQTLAFARQQQLASAWAASRAAQADAKPNVWHGPNNLNGLTLNTARRP